jgi:hypothetical protein
MPTLLLELKGNKYLNRTLFPPWLYVYDDILLYRKRRFIRVDEITLPYSHIVQVNLIQGLFWGTLEIINTGVQNVTIKFVWKGKARKAKELIDDKIYHAHAKHKPGDSTKSGNMYEFERSLNRLEELKKRGRISRKEYKKRRATLMQKY